MLITNKEICLYVKKTYLQLLIVMRSNYIVNRENKYSD